MDEKPCPVFEKEMLIANHMAWPDHVCFVIDELSNKSYKLEIHVDIEVLKYQWFPSIEIGT